MDLTIQAVSGLIAATGFPEGSPLKAGPAVVDLISGIHLCAATLTALFEGSPCTTAQVFRMPVQRAAFVSHGRLA